MRALLFFIFCFISIHSNSQEITLSLVCYDDFKFEYDFSVEHDKVPKETTVFIGAKNNQNILSQPNVKIEVQPMNDCMNGLAGAEFGESLKIAFNQEGQYYEVKFTTILRKCFKWRLISTSNDCEAQSEWNFITFSF